MKDVCRTDSYITIDAWGLTSVYGVQETSQDVEEQLTRRRNSIKPINDRVRRLRDQSVQSIVKVSAERAKLLSNFYASSQDIKEKSVALQRAWAFKYLLENCTIPIEDGQLIVGMRGTGPNEVPTYPEICLHSPQDLSILNSRKNMPFAVDEKTMAVYNQIIIPFWKGKTMRDIMFSLLSSEWKDAYDAGIFTEFMEQRTPGHTAGGGRIFKTGLLDIIDEIRAKVGELDHSASRYEVELSELEAMRVVSEAMIAYADRYSRELKRLARKEENSSRKRELEQMAEICSWVPAHAPRTFWEALQHYWFIHVGITYELNPWDSFTPGRFDQHLFPFYKKEIESKALTRETAKELLELFWLKFNNQPSVPKVGVTLEESFTYNDFSKINIGGLKEDGSDGVNELSYLLLEVLDEMKTMQPNTAILLSAKNPERFLRKALRVLAPGFGEPPLFNFDGAIVKMLSKGKSLVDSRACGVSGCVETGAFGKEAYILTGYLNLPKILELALNNGICPKTGKKIGAATGENFHSYEDIWNAFVTQLRHFIRMKSEGNDIIEELYSRYLPAPFLSLWIEDCVKNAKDYNSGGTRYNTSYIQVVGLGTLADSLASLKCNVFERKIFDQSEVLSALRNDFQGPYETMRQVFLNKTPKYGNDDDYVDDIAKRIVDTCVEIIESFPPTATRNASRRALFLPTTSHVYFGKMTGASSDGRKSGTPVSEGVSPAQGADKNGIAAVFRSVAKIDWDKSSGALLNQKLMPDLLTNEDNLEKMAQLIRAFFTAGGHHVQFNVVSSELLREAQKKPQDFKDLMVRVAGYSDYFVNLTKGLQDEIIARSEQGL